MNGRCYLCLNSWPALINWHVRLHSGKIMHCTASWLVLNSLPVKSKGVKYEELDD